MPEAKKPAQPSRADAEKRVADAEAALEDARNKLTEEQGELRAVVTREIPQMVVECLPNVHIAHGGKSYHGVEYGVIEGASDRFLHGEDSGPELTLDGPTAIALVMDGKVKIVRSL
jgi:hypothetical protein